MSSSSSNSYPLRELSGVFVALLLAGAVHSLLHTGGAWLKEGLPLALLLIPVVAGSLLYALTRTQWAWKRRGELPTDKGYAGTAAWITLAVALLLYLVASSSSNTWYYFLRWLPGEQLELTRSGLFRCLLVGGLLALALPWLRGRALSWLLALIALAALWMSLKAFGDHTHWQPVYRDDHPAFMYRLWVYEQIFPKLIYYDAFWNAGSPGLAVLASGTAGVGLTALPMLAASGQLPHEVYTPLLAGVYIVLLPLSGLLALRVAGGTWRAAWVAVPLMLLPAHGQFKWLYHFGTLGASFALPFVLLLAAALYRVLVLGKRDRVAALALIVAAAGYLIWPGGWLMLLPLALAVLCSPALWRKGALANWGFLSGCGALILLLVSPALYSTLHYTDPAGFAAAEPTRIVASEIWRKGWVLLGGQLREMNPLLIFFGLTGIAFLPRSRGRVLLGVAALALLLLSSWGSFWRPILQLDRAALPLSYLLVLPAALGIEQLLRHRDRIPVAVCGGWVLGLLMMTGYNAKLCFDNKGPAPYNAWNGDVEELATWITDNTSPEGRIMFAGIGGHSYGGGHLAYLPVMCERQMMAADYYHFSPKRVEYNYPPRKWRKPGERVWEFMNTYNIGWVVAYPDKYRPWLEFFRKRPEQYEEVHTFAHGNHPKTVFRVKREASWFVEGRGAVQAEINLLSVRLDDPQEPAIIRYHWMEGMHCEKPARIEAYPLPGEEEVSFIRIYPEGQERVLIRR